MTDLGGAVTALQEGAAVIYPTETFYGLGVDIENPQAVESLFKIKGRQGQKPVSILLASLAQAQKVVAEISPRAQKILERFFPGPLTVVLPASPHLNPRLHAGSGWIGIRQSSHPTAQALVEKYGRPLTTTSANPSGKPAAVRVSQVEDYFSSDENIFFLSGGDLPSSKGSTVVKVDGSSLKLIRAGEVEFKEIDRVQSS